MSKLITIWSLIKEYHELLFSGPNGVYNTKLVTGNNTLDRENPDILRDVGLYQFNLQVRNTRVLRWYCLN